MKISLNKQLPYPVLWKERDDYLPSSEFNGEIEDKKDTPEKVTFKFSVKLKNDLLSKLVAEGKAKIILHLECSNTKYREIKELKTGQNNISIDATKIEGDLEIIQAIIAQERLDDVRSNDFHEDYKNTKITFDSGAILAIGLQITYFADKQKEKISNISSIINVVPDHEIKHIVLDYSPDKIQLKLPEKDYILYKNYARTNTYFHKIILCSFIFPSMVNLLCLMSNKSWANEYEHKRWFKRLKMRLEKEECDINNDGLTAEGSLLIAQKIFDYPFSKALKDIETIDHSTEEVEE